MRKTFLTILILSITTVLSAVGSSYASPYKISQITNDSYGDYSSQINTNGYVVWYKDTGTTGAIFLYDGTSTIQLTNNSYLVYDKIPKINDNGNVVWERYDGSHSQIFLYDGTSTIQLSDNSYYNEYPQINNNGYLVWQGHKGSDYEIFLYDGTGMRTIPLLTDHSYPNLYPQINNNGYVVWQGWDGSDYEIFLYDGTRTTQLTDNFYVDAYPQINDNGQVVWMGYDGSRWQIFLYDGTRAIQISDGSYNNQYPQINNNGNVVWEGRIGGVTQIFLYDGTRTIQLTSNSFNCNGYPQINDSGYVVWQECDGSDSDIFLYDGAGITQITENSYADYYPQINNKGDIVWNGFFQNSESEIFIARLTQMILLSPNGSEKIPSGSIYTIKWAASLQAVKFDLMYSLNNGISWVTMATNVTGSSYDWTVPKPTNNKKKCLVKVIGYDASNVLVDDDTSDAKFTIEVVKVTSPDGGENWKVGSTHAIIWTTNGTKKPVANVKLFYTYNGGATWILIKTLNGNPGAYNWRASANSANCKVKVVLMDAIGKTIGSDVSDHLFTISP